MASNLIGMRLNFAPTKYNNHGPIITTYYRPIHSDNTV